MTARGEVQRVVNHLLPSGYRFWLTRDLYGVIYRHRRFFTMVPISDIRGPWVAINEINRHMAELAASTDCGRIAAERGRGPEFVLRMPIFDEKEPGN